MSAEMVACISFALDGGHGTSAEVCSRDGGGVVGGTVMVRQLIAEWTEESSVAIKTPLPAETMGVSVVNHAEPILMSG